MDRKQPIIVAWLSCSIVFSRTLISNLLSKGITIPRVSPPILIFFHSFIYSLIHLVVRPDLRLQNLLSS
ncbi:hypothetical protein J3Q64DRAFT_1769264 [Phycomyces blakesleeanus]|uniref:Uncharacterized protein n=1 Tax=Phycomyces blakesleeanus TaxID=4837 RepID=A0ABR3AN49_PHYBL